MGFKKGIINGKEFQLLEFGYGDIHSAIIASDECSIMDTLILHQGRLMPLGDMNEDNKALSDHVDLPRAIENGDVALWKFSKSGSIDDMINQLETIKQNLIENGK